MQTATHTPSTLSAILATRPTIRTRYRGLILTRCALGYWTMSDPRTAASLTASAAGLDHACQRIDQFWFSKTLPH